MNEPEARLGVLLICLLTACSPAAPATTVTTEAAATTETALTETARTDAAPDFLALLRGILGESSEGKRVYVANAPLRGGTAIPTWTRTVTVPARFARAWFVFVDDQPEANWEHAARYVFINAGDTSDFAVVQGRTPPDDLSSMRLLYPGN